MERFLTLSLLALTGCAATPPPAPPITTSPSETWSLLDGASATWGELVASSESTVVAFATTWCEACAREWPALLAWVDARPNTSLVYVVSGSPAEKIRDTFAARGQKPKGRAIVVDREGRLADRFGVTATPTLFLFDKTGARQGPWRELPEHAAEDHGTELGTSYAARIQIERFEDLPRARQDLAEARRIIPAFEAELSDWKESSVLGRLNRDRQVGLTSHLRTVLQGALHVARATGGAFDPTWASLGPVWEEAVRSGRWPPPHTLASARAGVGIEHIVVTDGIVRLDHPTTRVGLDGVAKGYIVDQVFLFLRRRGYAEVTVNIGGDLRTSSETSIEIAHPFRPGRSAGTLGVIQRALATSGNQLRRRRIGGRWLGHVLDPRTGEPAGFRGTVTVLAPDAAMADALATALLVLGPDIGIDFASRAPGIDVVYATRSGLRGTLTASKPQPERG